VWSSAFVTYRTIYKLRQSFAWKNDPVQSDWLLLMASNYVKERTTLYLLLYEYPFCLISSRAAVCVSEKFIFINNFITCRTM
jgi:hypothetical protein